MNRKILNTETRRHGDTAKVLKLCLCVSVSLCASLLAQGCASRHAQSATLVVEHEVTPRPPRVGTATITLSVADGAGRAVSGADVRLEGNMSHAGMSPVFGEATESEPGRYRAALDFTMAGDWVVLVHVTLPDGSKVERQFDVKGVRTERTDVSG